jgi:hypothetical protein
MYSTANILTPTLIGSDVDITNASDSYARPTVFREVVFFPAMLFSMAQCMS